jgi:hypothetical protein
VSVRLSWNMATLAHLAPPPPKIANRRRLD